MTIQAALHQATLRLSQASVDVPRLTAELLLAHSLGRDRAYLFAHGTDPLPGGLNFHSLVERRAARVPLQHLTGVQEFYGRCFKVSPEVLIPRPETEHVVERALSLAADAQRILDLGTGSGCIGITLACELDTPVLLSDLSAPALGVARVNAHALHAACHFVQADALTAMAPASLDLIVSNPPYIPLAERDTLAEEVRDHDPALALFGGETGNEVYARILAEAPRVLRQGGSIVLELGWQSAPAVTALAGEHWTQVRIDPDLAGRPRVFSAQLR